MSDDRFTDGNPYRRRQAAVEIAVDDALKRMIADGQVEQAEALISLLPEDRREHYRTILKGEGAK